ncbi:MAG: hypothetical protein JNJ88_02375 [Planctomycetes bacterium]|nr:hypothetical protein [Planctomycetota bacterium]
MPQRAATRARATSAPKGAARSKTSSANATRAEETTHSHAADAGERPVSARPAKAAPAAERPAPATATLRPPKKKVPGNAEESVSAAPPKAGLKRVVVAPVEASAPPKPVERPERVIPEPEERPMSPEELSAERDRIYARLTAIPNVISRPSPADYVVFEVADPEATYRKLVSLGVPSENIQKYPKLPNGMRVFVKSARRNEAFIRALELATK